MVKEYIEDIECRKRRTVFARLRSNVHLQIYFENTIIIYP